MKMKKTASLLLAAALMISCFSACGDANNTNKVEDSTPAVSENAGNTAAPADDAAKDTSNPTKTVTVTDDSGREVTVAMPIEKAVLLDTSPFAVLSAFGKLDVIVGNHQATEGNPLYDELAGLPVVATHSEVNYEMLAELQPQVVLSSVRAHGVVTEQENLSGFDIEDIKLDLRHPDNMRSGIKLMGQLFSSEEKANEIIAFYDKWEDFISERVGSLSDEERVKVFLEYHAGNYKTGAPNSRFYSQVVLAGGINIAEELTSGEEPEVSAEWIAEMDPDIIVREASGMGYMAENTDKAKEIYDELVGREGLAMTKAVQNKNVHIVCGDIYSRPGYIVGVCYMAKWFYPDLFEDFDPADVLQEYFEIFHPGKEVRGVWTYDE